MGPACRRWIHRCVSSDSHGSERSPEVTPELSFVLPAHNEIGLLGSTVTNIVTGLDQRQVPYEIVVVENGSSDGTLAHLRGSLAAQIAQSSGSSALPRGNYGAALVAGFRAARGTIVVNFDVDYYDLGFLDAATAILRTGDVDVVVASKRAHDSVDRRPLIRRFLTFAFTSILRAVIKLPVSDAHGMKAMRRETTAPIVALCRLRGSIYDVEPRDPRECPRPPHRRALPK